MGPPDWTDAERKAAACSYDWAAENGKKEALAAVIASYAVLIRLIEDNPDYSFLSLAKNPPNITSMLPEEEMAAIMKAQSDCGLTAAYMDKIDMQAMMRAIIAANPELME